MENSMKQLRNNVEQVVWEYLNGQMDEGEEEYPNLTVQQWWDYCVPEIYNMRNNGHGSTLYAEGISDHLKFLGNEKIREVIVEVAGSEGLLVA